MDNQNQILLDQLLALLRAGCEVRLTPLRTPMGFIDAQVRVIPPPSENPTTPLEEFRKIKTGATVALAQHRDSMYNMAHKNERGDAR